MTRNELQGKVALITGSTDGIGAETAKLMAAEGAEVIISGRDAERGAAVVREIEDAGGKARFIQADLGDLDAVRRLAGEAGAVDILVNNAAFVGGGPSVSQDVASYDQAFVINVRAPYFLTAALAPAMLARGSGSIVNVTTMVAHIALPGMSVYSASKAALTSLTRTWAAEFGASGVRVNAVSPGPTVTDKVRSQPAAEDRMNQLAAGSLLKRTAAPSEIAEAILFLASERSSYVTGTTLSVDAGRTAV